MIECLRARSQRAACAFLLLVLLSLAAACSDDDGGNVGLATLPSEFPETVAPTAPEGEPTRPAATPTATIPAVSGMACPEREAVYAELETAVAAALEGYNGEWGFAFHDLQCELMATVQGNHLQYSASSGKIVSAIAAARAVERGDVELAELEPHIDEVFSWSSDHDAHMLETFVEEGALAEVLADAGVTEPSYTEGAWNYTFLTPVDMAKIWTALVQGELLSEEWTQYLLDKTGLAEIPDGLETFPDARFDLEGFQWGQKAGYYVADGIPYFLVGAGFLVEQEGPEAFIPVVMMRTENAEFLDPQRREVWPLVVDAVVEVTGAPPPADVGPGPWGAGAE